MTNIYVVQHLHEAIPQQDTICASSMARATTKAIKAFPNDYILSIRLAEKQIVINDDMRTEFIDMVYPERINNPWMTLHEATVLICRSYRDVVTARQPVGTSIVLHHTDTFCQLLHVGQGSVGTIPLPAIQVARWVKTPDRDMLGDICRRLTVAFNTALNS